MSVDKTERRIWVVSGDVFMHTSPPDKTVCLHSYVIGVQHKIIKVLNKIAWNVGDGNTLQDV